MVGEVLLPRRRLAMLSPSKFCGAHFAAHVAGYARWLVVAGIADGLAVHEAQRGAIGVDVQPAAAVFVQIGEVAGDSASLAPDNPRNVRHGHRFHGRHHASRTESLSRSAGSDLLEVEALENAVSPKLQASKGRAPLQVKFGGAGEGDVMASKYNIHDLFNVATMGTELLHINQVFAWRAKIDYLAVVLQDLPALGTAVTDEEARSRPAEAKPGVPWFPDRRPEIRLAMAIEAGANSLYALAEIAAQVANKATRTRNGGFQIPASFNGICKAIKKDHAPAELVEALGDLSWYGRVHELRTEWAHYSAVFIGLYERNFTVYAERGREDRVHFPADGGQPVQVDIDQFVSWLQGAVRTTSNLAGHILERFVLPSLDLDEPRITLQRGPDGIPLFETNGCGKMRTVTVRELLSEVSIPR